ncbi:MAG: ABC transporter permease [Chitinophagaceae bacterium]|nr:ABC transporter permease [Chitinophagaceae bacterium]
MFKNYLKTTWRNLQKNSILSLINLGGLSVGIAAVLLIGLYIFSETGYDDFQQNKSSLYRVGFHYWQNGKSLGEGASFTAPFGADAKNEFPEVKDYTRISSERIAYVSYNDKMLKLENIHHADSNFFHLFSFKLLKGDPKTVLKEPYSLVLTSETAKKLFGSEENAMNKIVKLDNQINFMVTGVAQEAPANSHLSYNALISFATLYKEPNNFMDWNGGQQYITYLQLKEKTDVATLEKKLPAFMWNHINEQYSKVGIKVDASLQPIKDIHLYYSDNSETLRTNIFVFGIVALLILIISCANYINISIAGSITRFKEVGVRKVLGAGRGNLVKQFLTETVLLTTMAFFISIVLVSLLKPAYQYIIGKSLPSLSINILPILLLLLIIVMLVGIIAGSYIAFYLSSFNVTRVFKSLIPKNSPAIFRKSLIVMQFIIAGALMACTFIVSLQLQYSKHINMGFDKDKILVLPLVGDNTQAACTTLQEKLSQMSAVQQVSALSEIPYDGITSNGFIPEGETKAMIIHELDADETFPKTFNINMVAGEFFSKDHPALQDGYVINETLAKTLGWQNPLGKTISRDGNHKVIGVIKDFHFASLHDNIEPLIITNKPWKDRFAYIALKYQGDNISALIDDVKRTWKATIPNASFDYWFLDDAFNTVYKNEERFQQMFLYFSALSIILSLAGIFGLVTLTIKQRTKEFGIRKVLGAGFTDMIQLIAKDFVWQIILATIIAAPLAWIYMNKWLQNFAYRIQISGWVFVFCGVIILVITIIVISFQAIKAAMANPVKSLRTE